MKKSVLLTALSIPALMYANAAKALCVPLTPINTVDINIALGRIVVKPSDEVGKILKKEAFHITPNLSTFGCALGGQVEATLSQGSTLSSLGNHIYNTNIPGIGIRLYRQSETSTDYSGYYPYTRPVGFISAYYLSSGDLFVEIIKTANSTGSGALTPGRYSSYSFVSFFSHPLLTSTVYNNGITIAFTSCEIQGNTDKVVQLPTVMKSGFKGVGSTQGEQSFDMNILCNGGANSTGYIEKNAISLSYDFVQDGTNSQVLSNTATASEKANGVGVQLVWNYKNENHVIQAGDKLLLGTVSSNQNRQYHVPMTARYYQTASNVTAGKVRARATVTIDYD